MEMDTDSLYMATAGEIDDIIKPELREEYFRTRAEWFPGEACASHSKAYVTARVAGYQWRREQCCVDFAAHERRTPGLFKEEYKGDGMIALNSKTYCCWRDDDPNVKVSSKGISKRTNKLTKEQFKRVLYSKIKHTGVNRGFVCKQNRMFTYKQLKCALTFFYAKRRVDIDGVTTTNINI